jgi:hypothetical protein
MTHARRFLAAAAGSAAVLAGVTAGAATASTDPASISAARAATARFHHQHDGYSLLVDAAGIACIDNPGVGGMGIHYVNGTLVGDGQVNALTPELVVYEPGRDGRLRLVAAEYVVFQDAWDVAHASPPELFGQTFELVGAGNRYGLPPFYELHAWLWEHNRAGMFEDWNPRVSCPGA